MEEAEEALHGDFEDVELVEVVAQAAVGHGRECAVEAYGDGDDLVRGAADLELAVVVFKLDVAERRPGRLA